MQIGKDIFRVFAASYGTDPVKTAPGTILSAGEEGIEIACGDNRSIRITELQAAGKKRMRAADFLRGRRLDGGLVSW